MTTSPEPTSEPTDMNNRKNVRATELEPDTIFLDSSFPTAPGELARPRPHKTMSAFSLAMLVLVAFSAAVVIGLLRLLRG